MFPTTTGKSRSERGPARYQRFGRTAWTEPPLRSAFCTATAREISLARGCWRRPFASHGWKGRRSLRTTVTELRRVRNGRQTLIKLAGTTTALMLVLGVATAQAGDVRGGAEAMTDGAAQGTVGAAKGAGEGAVDAGKSAIEGVGGMAKGAAEMTKDPVKGAGDMARAPWTAPSASPRVLAKARSRPARMLSAERRALSAASSNPPIHLA
jgi:hypothetical protein